MAKSSIKAGAPELFEEGLQDVNEKLQHNLWRKSNDQEGPYSAGDMFVGAGEAMWQALPAVVGFGVIGGGISANTTFMTDLNATIADLQANHNSINHLTLASVVPAKLRNDAGMIGAVYQLIKRG